MVNICEPFKCSNDKGKRNDDPFHPRRSPSDVDSPIRIHDIVNWRNSEMISDDLPNAQDCLRDHRLNNW
jgi:hypothetical protein